jgi:ATP phosphoribosyltransferase regulatory subunit
VIHRIPSGTRDVLPDELRELRAIEARMRGVFEVAGYGEVATPALEYESVLARGDVAATNPLVRHFDEHGDLLVLRSDMTLPIARVVASRYATAEPPLRFCYVAPVYRAVRPQRGQPRELLQAGVELVGAAAPHGTAEVLRVLCAALEAAGLERFRVGLGDAGLYPDLLAGLGVPEPARADLLARLAARDLVGLEQRVAALGLPAPAAAALVAVPEARGGREVLEAVPAGPAADAVRRLVALWDLLEPPVAERIIFDLGLSRGLGYYTGAVFEVYDPALGVPLGGGGRYDELLGRFGRALPAVGFALTLERVHLALTGEERASIASPP